MPLFRKTRYKRNSTTKRQTAYRPKFSTSTRKKSKKIYSRNKKTFLNSRRVRKKVKSKLAVLAYAVIVIFFTVLLAGGYVVYKFANAPFSSAAGVDYNDTEKVWNDDEVTLVVARLDDIHDSYSEINKLGLVYFDVPSKRYTIYEIPVDIEIEYALNAGKGTFRRIYAVGNVDQNRGTYLMQKTMQKLFAIHTDGYILTDDNGYDEMTKLIGDINSQDLSASLRLKNWPKIPQFISTFRKVCITNLKFNDILAIDSFIRNTSYSSSNVISLNKYHLLDAHNWDSIWQKRRGLSPVKAEGVKVFIANASNDPKIPGLAQWGARIVQNVGADVLEDDNSVADFHENTIVTTDATLLTVRKLAQSLNIKNIIVLSDDEQSVKKYNPQVYRTKVSLFLTSF